MKVQVERQMRKLMRRMQTRLADNYDWAQYPAERITPRTLSETAPIGARLVIGFLGLYWAIIIGVALIAVIAVFGIFAWALVAG